MVARMHAKMAQRTVAITDAIGAMIGAMRDGRSLLRDVGVGDHFLPARDLYRLHGCWQAAHSRWRKGRPTSRRRIIPAKKKPAATHGW